MKTTPRELRDPDHVLQYLSSLLRVVHAGLDSGISLADQWFGSMKYEYDSMLWCFIVRYGADCYMRDLPPADDWEIGRELPMRGIQVYRLPLVVRVLKAQGDGPPPPGPSHRRQAYYSQQWQLPGPWETVEVLMPEGPNHILDWSVNADRTKIALHLSRPNGVWRRREDQKLDWRREVIVGADDTPRFIGTEERDIEIGAVIEETELGTGSEAT